MSFAKMSVGNLSFAQMSFAKLTFVQMSFAQMLFAKVSPNYLTNVSFVFRVVLIVSLKTRIDGPSMTSTPSTVARTLALRGAAAVRTSAKMAPEARRRKRRGAVNDIKTPDRKMGGAQCGAHFP